jgi:hypothetical protein
MDKNNYRLSKACGTCNHRELDFDCRTGRADFYCNLDKTLTDDNFSYLFSDENWREDHIVHQFAICDFYKIDELLILGWEK